MLTVRLLYPTQQGHSSCTETSLPTSALVGVRRFRRLWKGCCRSPCLAPEPSQPRRRLGSPCICRCAASRAAGDRCAPSGPLRRGTLAHRARTGREARHHYRGTISVICSPIWRSLAGVSSSITCPAWVRTFTRLVSVSTATTVARTVPRTCSEVPLALGRPS
jgi:hypothetical protein